MARKYKDVVGNTRITAPALADSNKMPGQIWSDDENAIINRMAEVIWNRVESRIGE